MIARSIRPPFPIDLRHTLGAVRRGRTDPTMVITPGASGASATEVWRATRTPDGPATTCITARPSGELTMQAWGPGAAWAVDGFPALVGATSEDSPFPAAGPVVADLRRRLRGLRICRTGAVTEAIVPTILEQKVIGSEARRSYARLVRALGEEAPGPGPGSRPRLFVPPAPEVLARTPAGTFHRFGIERKRADTVRMACSYAHRLDETAGLPLDEAYARLTALPGVGAWTAAEVALVALGDRDAVSVGDYHLPHQVAYALAGERRADDTRMLELLAPYRGYRGWVIRLIVAAGIGPPRRGPRLALNPIAGL